MKLGHVLSIAISACLVTLVFSYLVGAPLPTAAPAPIRAEVPPITAESIAGIDARLERIEDALSVTASVGTTRRPVQAVEDPEPDPLAEALARIEKLETELLRRAPLPGGSTTAPPLNRAAPIDWAAIEALRPGNGQRREVTEVRLMTAAEAIARFGFPPRVTSTPGGMNWTYERPDGMRLKLLFGSGYVLYADVR